MAQFKYIAHKEDKINILFCEIKVWQPSSIDKWAEEPQKYLKFNEVVSVEIHKSYKQLISTAIIKLPRGAVMNSINKTFDQDEVITAYTIKDAPVNISRSDTGVLQVVKGDQTIVKSSNLAVGQRIEIRLAYASSDKEFNEWMQPNAINKGDRVFTGWITKCSVDDPLEIECEDILSMLKKKQCPNIAGSKNFTVQDFLSANGKYKLLNGTGIALDKETEATTMNVGMVPLTDNLVLADVLTEWSKCGLFAFLNDTEKGVPTLRIGRVYSSNVTDDKGNIVGSAPAMSTSPLITFDWDVAGDKLKVQNLDKHYLAIEAHAANKEGKFVKLTVRPGGIPDDTAEIKDFDIVNFHEPRKRSGYKNQGGNESGGTKDKVDMSSYNIVPYFSPRPFTTKQALAEEAKQYWGKYNKNGMEGSLKLFGDVTVYPTCSIGLLDPRAQERNGLYFVESVDINFDTSGYRKEVKLPYRIAKYGKVEITR